MPRLFVAIDLPDLQRRGLRALCHGLSGEVRWTSPEQLHLTLRFIGEVDEALFLEIKKALADLLFPPFVLRIQGVGSFPPGRRARVLWAGVDVSPELEQLHQLIEERLGRLGLPPEERPFHPHLTLARLPERLGPEILAAYFARHSRFAVPPFPVDRFHLYSSRLSRFGAVHHLEGSYGRE